MADLRSALNGAGSVVEYEDSVTSRDVVEQDLLNLGVVGLLDAVVAGEVGLLVIGHVVQRLEGVLVETEIALAATDVLQGDEDCLAAEVTLRRARKWRVYIIEGCGAIFWGTVIIYDGGHRPTGDGIWRDRLMHNYNARGSCVEERTRAIWSYGEEQELYSSETVGFGRMQSTPSWNRSRCYCSEGLSRLRPWM